MTRAAAALLLLGAAAMAASGVDRIQKLLDRGEKALAKVEEAKGDSKRLRALRLAEPSFRTARLKARAALPKAPEAEIPALQAAESAATLRLVAILNAETVLYLKRGALSSARKVNEEALSLLPEDLRAKELEDELEDPPEDELDATASDRALEQALGLSGLLRNRSAAERRYAGRREGLAGGRPSVR